MTTIKLLFSKFFSLLNTLRKILINSIFYLFFLVIILSVFSSDNDVIVPNNAALILNLNGDVVEQKKQVDPIDAFVGELSSKPKEGNEILLTDIIKVIEHAKSDTNINTLVLKLADLDHVGLTQMSIIGKALNSFKESGKQVISLSDSYSQEQYYLASYANQIWLNPNGWLMLDGYGRFQMYYKSAFDKLDISQHIFRVGTYKSAVEPYMRDDMSSAAKKANKVWLNDLWTLYKNDVSLQRNFTPDNFDENSSDLLKKLTAAKGKISQYALDNHWVDSLKTREQMQVSLTEIVGKNKDDGFNHVTFEHYLASISDPFPITNPNQDKIAIVVAKGTILDGKQPAGTIGGDSTAALLRKARKDDSIKAVVLRVDSPGGSAFASEIIRQEVEQLKEAGKPVVASMGSYAASGGYWISAPANKIYASPSTITGSIGIFGLFMTFENTLEKMGIHTDGVGTTDLAGLSVTRALPSTMGDIFQVAIERGYQDFITLVAENRNMTLAQVDKIAQGRVWSGLRAKSLGLVDELGDLSDAIKAAASIAGLTDYSTKVLEKELSARDKFLKELFKEAHVMATPFISAGEHNTPGVIAKLLFKLETELNGINNLNDPQGIYALCLPCNP